MLTLTDFDSITWLLPWEPWESGTESQLAKEAGPGHLLHGRKAVSVAHRVDQDDFLFFLPEGPAPLAVVHLTFAPMQLTAPHYSPDIPWTKLYSSLEEWIVERMEPNHREYSSPDEPIR